LISLFLIVKYASQIVLQIVLVTQFTAMFALWKPRFLHNFQRYFLCFNK
jgi:hypothetical protein